MASLWKDSRTTCLVACFSAVVGNRLVQWKRSTFTKDRKMARRISDALEDAAQGRMDAEAIRDFLNGVDDLRARRNLRRVFDDVLRKTVGSGLEGKTARAYVTLWLDRTKGEVSKATWAKYEQTARLFLESLGGKADRDFNELQREDITRFRDEQGKRVAASTANLALKIVRVIFAAAETDGVIARNEARLVKKLKAGTADNSKRRAFTLPEVRRLLAACDDEWRSLVLFGFYTGARLGDLAGLTWQNLDLERGELVYTSRKTRRTVIVPLSEALRAHVESLDAGDDPRQPLHPRAWKIVERENRTGTLSRQFGELLADAGLITKRTHRAAKQDGPGRSARRTASEVSFHCLRHTSNTLMKKAGVPEAVVRDIVGHDSAAVSRLYTHMDDDAKRAGVNRLPKL